MGIDMRLYREEKNDDLENMENIKLTLLGHWYQDYHLLNAFTRQLSPMFGHGDDHNGCYERRWGPDALPDVELSVRRMMGSDGRDGQRLDALKVVRDEIESQVLHPCYIWFEWDN